MAEQRQAEKGAMPKRIQRRRTKGWRMPEGVIFVGRGSKWGNPFKVERVPRWPRWAGTNPRQVVDSTGRLWDWPEGDAPPERPVVFNQPPDYIDGDTYYEHKAARLAVHLFSLHAGPMGNYEIEADDLAVLAGRDLACWCPEGAPCHADVLLEWANSERTTSPVASTQ